MKNLRLNCVILLLFATSDLMAGAIIGRVVHETDGSPAPSVKLYCVGGREIYRPGEKSTSAHMTTDKEGTFYFKELVPGKYSISIENIPDPAWTYRHLYNIIVSENQDTTVKLMLVKGQMLRGCVQDCRGNAVGGALLDIEGTNVFFRTTSDEKGHFAVHVPTGDYVIEVIDAPQKYQENMDIQMNTCNGALKFGYGPTVLASVKGDKTPPPVLCVLYPTATQETYPPSEPSSETNLLALATRHIVSWMIEGVPLPGTTPIQYVDSTNRVDGNFSVVCDYLPNDVTISTNPCINRLSRPEYKAITQERGWNKGAGYITIVWTKTGGSGHTQGFIVIRNFKNSCKSWYEVVFKNTPDGVKAKYEYLSHTHSSSF